MEPRNLIRWIPRCLKPHWANSPCLKTNSEQFSTVLNSDWLIDMEPQNLIGWTLRCLKPHRTKSPCLKTSPERFSTVQNSDWLIDMEPQNLIGWTPRWSKPHWMSSPYPITYGPTMFNTSYTLVIDFTKIDVLLTLMQTDPQTIFFHMTLPTVEGISIYRCCMIVPEE